MKARRLVVLTLLLVVLPVLLAVLLGWGLDTAPVHCLSPWSPC